MGKYDFETCESAFYQARKEESIESASKSGKLRNKKKIYSAAIDTLSEFLGDEEAVEKAKEYHKQLTYLIQVCFNLLCIIIRNSLQSLGL